MKRFAKKQIGILCPILCAQNICELEGNRVAMRINILLVVVFIATFILPTRNVVAGSYIVGLPCASDKDCRSIPLESLVTEIYRRVGIEVEFRYQPKMRELADADHNVIDASGARALSILSPFKNLIPVPVPIIEVRYVALTRSGDRIRQIDDLHEFKVGVVRGDLFGSKTIAEHEIQIYYVNSFKTGLRMLKQGRIRALLTETGTLALYKGEGLGEGVRRSGTLFSEKMYHVVNKKHVELVPRLAEVIRAMQSDGTMERLLGDLNHLQPVEAAP